MRQRTEQRKPETESIVQSIGCELNGCGILTFAVTNV